MKNRICKDKTESQNCDKYLEAENGILEHKFEFLKRKYGLSTKKESVLKLLSGKGKKLSEKIQQDLGINKKRSKMLCWNGFEKKKMGSWKKRKGNRELRT